MAKDNSAEADRLKREAEQRAANERIGKGGGGGKQGGGSNPKK